MAKGNEKGAEFGWHQDSGYVDHPHTEAHAAVLEKYGLSAEDIMTKRTMYNYRDFEKKDGGE